MGKWKDYLLQNPIQERLGSNEKSGGRHEHGTQNRA